MRISGPRRCAGFQPIPTFMLRPNKFPEGCVSNISGVSGRMPSGPGAWVATVSVLKSVLSNTDVNEMV
jgi:hypothetical protein